MGGRQYRDNNEELAAGGRLSVLRGDMLGRSNAVTA